MLVADQSCRERIALAAASNLQNPEVEVGGVDEMPSLFTDAPLSNIVDLMPSVERASRLRPWFGSPETQASVEELFRESEEVWMFIRADPQTAP